MTAKELHNTYLPRHTAKGIQRMRERKGRYKPNRRLVCCKCNERPVWVESPSAKRLWLCKGCYLEEEKQRLNEAKLETRIRKMRSRNNHDKQ
ncbi:MAG: hypothetical protein KHZ79_07175 [Atopobium minutum]|nr:hypothetical protein [Atopobium minutum]